MCVGQVRVENEIHDFPSRTPLPYMDIEIFNANHEQVPLIRSFL